MVNPVVDVYTDGSCLKNPGPGGIAYLIKYQEEDKDKVEDKEVAYALSYRYTTNNRMEVIAAISAIKYIIDKVENDESWKEIHQVHIYSDSEYLCNATNKNWLKSWQERNWMTKGYGDTQPKEVKNKDLWKEYLEVAAILRALSITIIFTWVKGHNDNPDNERVDNMARDIAANGDEFEIDTVYENLVQQKRNLY